jgi:hypothetical protein
MTALDAELAPTLIDEVFAGGIYRRLLRVVKARRAVGVVPFVCPLPVRAAVYHAVLRFAHRI